MDTLASLNHSVWELQVARGLYPEVLASNAVLGGAALGQVSRQLALQKESTIEGRHLLPDHVHMSIAIPPTYAVAQVLGFIKGRARSIWRACMANGTTILWGNISRARVHRLDRGQRRANHPGVHPQAGAGRRAPGPAGTLEATAASESVALGRDGPR